ncbi:hypothetical protein [Candidatus Nitrosacidococcus sp. I8]|uniref:hypothetical protein n=1 Tax=Candidatus Nitrosacidococcus sp. I8 TaxID=2942908 RepID=UPI002225F5B7|nr:hypothetical protein [Candidatus Nitrosacidococcus sp. I8]CAH9017867.1 hypothetical protein NURINAE_00598 [Candidatus Nitrosacidococcus sp. I8]
MNIYDNDSNELSPLRTMPKTIDAVHFNRVRLALRRISNPLQIPLPKHRGLLMLLDNKEWLCVDSFHADRLILAWRSFDTSHRQGIHEPISCKLSFYHMHAGLIMGSAIEHLSQTLAQQLEEVRPHSIKEGKTSSIA